MTSTPNRDLVGASDLIIGAWQNFRAHLNTYLSCVLALTTLALLQWILTIFIRNAVTDAVTRTVLTALVTLPIWLLTTAVGIAVLHLTWDALRERQPDLPASFAYGAGKLVPFIWVSILVGAVLFFGAILLVLPFVYFLVTLAFATTELVINDVRGTNALRASSALVRGRWWPVMWRLLVPMLFFSLASLLATAILDLVIGSFLGDPRLFFSDVTAVQSLTNAQLLVTTVVPRAVAAVALPLNLAASLLLWSDLRRG